MGKLKLYRRTRVQQNQSPVELSEVMRLLYMHDLQYSKHQSHVATVNLKYGQSDQSINKSCPTLVTLGLYSPWNSPSKYTRVGSLSLLQGIFSTQGSNPGLPHSLHILYQLSHQGSPQESWSGQPIFLQCIFPTQESNWGLLHCRWILYQLSYEGSPNLILINCS